MDLKEQEFSLGKYDEHRESGSDAGTLRSKTFKRLSQSHTFTTEASSHTDPLEMLKDIYDAGAAIMKQKNHDYRGGSGDPYANFRGSTQFGIDPIVGILLRVQDKLMRIKTFAEKGELRVEGESVKDALIDVTNYMGLVWGLINEAKS